MGLAAKKAYLGTEGSREYRNCDISYYTYTMLNEPNKHHIVTSVHMNSNCETHSDYTVTLTLDKWFAKENSAVNYGVREAKKYIDKSYAEGRLI